MQLPPPSTEDAIQLFAELVLILEEQPTTDVEAFLRAHPEHAEELRALLRCWKTLEPRPASGNGSPRVAKRSREEEVLAGLKRRASARYRRGAIVARGGMGVVFRARDRLLERDVAMKVLPSAQAPDRALRFLRRFLQEASVTGELGHPGIVPVHDAGVDEQGRVFFTMPLLEGVDFSTFLKELHGGRPSRNLPRALEVLLRVCDALDYAHSRGVVHRDVNPSNVLVGRYGEVYLLDWGLAHASRRGERVEDLDEVRVPVAGDSPAEMTVAGEVIGTPHYMPPEQARCDRAPRAKSLDVYGVGAMLYELLSGRRPYAGAPGSSGSTVRETLAAIEEGPPAPLAELAPATAPELVAICDKAMARRPEERYGDVRALAADLRAFLDGRVVRAHRTGAWIELCKWVARNTPLACALAAVVLLSFAALVGKLYLEEGERQRVQRVADLTVLTDLERRADELWPVRPDRAPHLRSWLAEAERFLARAAGSRAVLAEMRRGALAYDDDQRARDRATHPARDELAGLEVQREVLQAGLTELAPQADVDGDHGGTPAERIARLDARMAALEERMAERRTWRFEDPAEQAEHDALARLVEGATRLEERVVPDVERRLADAETIVLRSVVDVREAWAEARSAIAASPHYGGLSLPSQVGLVPLGPDPGSGLWEFAHLASGRPATRAADGRLQLSAETGLVLVLVPAGTFAMGARAPSPEEPAGPNVDPDAHRRDGPVAPVTLDAFFLAKHEMTQPQWSRLASDDPSYVSVTRNFGWPITELHPVESVPWDEASEHLRRWNLALPSEAQWEYAARAGTTTPTWAGTTEDLIGRENVQDHSRHRTDLHHKLPPDWDGYAAHAPVDALTPNPWGFHHVLGNVSEWVADEFVVDQRWPREPGTGLRRPPQSFGLRILRGGSYSSPLKACRSAARIDVPPGKYERTIGIRPARAVER